MVDVFEEYFPQLSSKVLRDNFATVHQLLDEMIDSGFLFTTESSILKEMILPPTIVNRTKSLLTGASNVVETIPDITFTSLPWRKLNIRYRTNEIYFDVTEKVDALFEANGSIVSGEIVGEIMCESKLSGMPDITVQLSKPEILEDCVFHPCVRYSRFEREKILSFIPPDGQFKLATYKIKTTNFKLPVHVKPVISFVKKDNHVHLSVGSRLIGNPKPADDVVVKISLPDCAIGHSLKATIGDIKFDDKLKILMWEIGSMPRDRLPTLNGDINFSPGSVVDSIRPDLLVEFKLMSFNISGLQITSVNISDEKSWSYKGARYFTKAGILQFRT